MAKSETENRGRLQFVDGMRGIAALGVAVFHLGMAHTGEIFKDGNPTQLIRAISWGRGGVQVFFVISGFVIAYSLTRCDFPSQIGRFLVRRSIRLDPMYWLSMALAVLVIPIATSLGLPAKESPTWTTIGIHLLYLQDILDREALVGVYWTLCLEIQFYLVFAILLCLSHHVAKWCKLEHEKCVSGVFLVMTLFCGLWATGFLPWQKGWFYSLYHCFLIGVFCCWFKRRPNKKHLFFVMYGLMLLGSVTTYGKSALTSWAVLLSTPLVLLTVDQFDWHHKLLTSAFWQRMGVLSYGIYLFHLPLGGTAMDFFRAYMGDSYTLSIAWVNLCLGLVLTIGISELAYRFVEVPSIALSKRIKVHRIS